MVFVSIVVLDGGGKWEEPLPVGIWRSLVANIPLWNSSSSSWPSQVVEKTGKKQRGSSVARAGSSILKNAQKWVLIEYIYIYMHFFLS